MMMEQELNVGQEALAPSSDSTPEVSTPANEAPASEVNWSDYAGEMDDEPGDGDAPLAVEGAEEVPAPKSEEPPPAPPVSEAPQAPTPTLESVATTAAPTPTPTPPSPAPVSPEPEVKYEDWRKEQVGKLEGAYKLSDEMAAQLLAEPEVVLPKLFADLHMKVLETAMKSVTAVIPTMMQEVQSTNTRETEAKSMFFGVNEDLTDAKFQNAIMEFGTMFRRVNPAASPEEATKVIGNMVRTAFGIPVRGDGQQPAASAVPAAPAATSPAPFVPARGGGSGAAPPPAQNVWANLAQEFIDET
jgi:hypothetical protein